MSKEKTLVKNTIIYTIGNFGSKVLSFILLPFYTRYLTPADYGYFDLISNFLTLLIPIVTFQMNEGVYRFLLDTNSEEDKTKVISTSVNVLLRNLIVVNIVYIILVIFLNVPYKYMAIILFDVSIIWGMWMQIARGMKENIMYSTAGVLYTVTTLLSNIILIVGVNLRVSALIVSNIIACITVIVYVEYKLKLRSYIKRKYNNFDLKKKLIKYSLPLIPTTISWWLMNISGRYAINYFEGIDATGIYAISNKFSSFLVMISSIFYLAWLESAISEYNSENKNEFYSKIFNIFMTLQFTIVLMLIPATKIVILLGIDPRFHSAWRYVPFLYLGAIFSGLSSFYDAAYLSSKNTVGSSVTSLVGAVSNVLLNITLIPMLGIQGASVSIFLSFFIVWVIRIYQTKKYFNIKINIKKMIILSIVSVAYICIYHFSNRMIEIVLIILAVLMFIIFNKNLIYNALEYIKNIKKKSCL